MCIRDSLFAHVNARRKQTNNSSTGGDFASRGFFSAERLADDREHHRRNHGVWRSFSRKKNSRIRIQHFRDNADGDGVHPGHAAANGLRTADGGCIGDESWAAIDVYKRQARFTPRFFYFQERQNEQNSVFQRLRCVPSLTNRKKFIRL